MATLPTGQPGSQVLQCTKYLSPPKTELCSTSLADLGEVMCEPDTCSLTVAISDAVVVGVNDLQSRKECIKINVVVPPMILYGYVPSILWCKRSTDVPRKCLWSWSWNAFIAFQNTIRKNTEDDTIDETTIAERIMTILLLLKPSPAHMQDVWSQEFNVVANLNWWYTRLELNGLLKLIMMMLDYVTIITGHVKLEL